MKKSIFIILGLFLFGCAKKPVKIGVVLPLSGELSSYGDMCLKGLELAATSINEKGGIKGRQIELLTEDNKGEPGLTRTAIEKFDKEDVIAVIGPLTTENIVEIGEYVDELKLPLITPSATGIKATEGREWLWRISFTDVFQGIALAKFARENLKVSSVCIILNPEDSYSRGLSRSFEDAFKRLGGKKLLSVTFKTGDTRFDTQLATVRKQKPDCIFVPVFYNEAGLIIREAREKGIALPFIGGDGLDSPELAKIIGEQKGEVYYSTHFFYNYGIPEVQDFLHQFKLKYQQEPQTFSALGCDAIRLVSEVLKRSSGFSREEFNSNIRKTSFAGATGTISFLESRDPRRSLMVLKFEPGKPIETIRVF